MIKTFQVGLNLTCLCAIGVAGVEWRRAQTGKEIRWKRPSRKMLGRKDYRSLIWLWVNQVVVSFWSLFFCCWDNEKISILARAGSECSLSFSTWIEIRACAAWKRGFGEWGRRRGMEDWLQRSKRSCLRLLFLYNIHWGLNKRILQGGYSSLGFSIEKGIARGETQVGLQFHLAVSSASWYSDLQSVVGRSPPSVSPHIQLPCRGDTLSQKTVMLCTHTLKSAGMLDHLCAKYHACEGDSIPDSVAIRN